MTEDNGEILIKIKNCRVEASKECKIKALDWQMNKGQSWLITGPNGGGKADFINALSKTKGFAIIPNQNDGEFANCFEKSCELVSLERAASLIQEERENDESEYLPGGVDIGRTARKFLGEVENSEKIENDPVIKLCGIEKILDRGLKYLSTGEIRRTLLARALLSRKELIILSDPFAGLDQQSRTILLDFINSIQKKRNTNIILSMERWNEIPDSITHVLEFKNREISFCGERKEYEELIFQRQKEENTKNEKAKEALAEDFKSTLQEGALAYSSAAPAASAQAESLIKMTKVNVGWGDNHVLKDLTWELKENEHWLIRGPNGSGKTTFLELITGDNKQVYANDVKIFGIQRGSGESIWDIKKHLGIVSYRMHVEYRMLGGTSILNVIISGFRDSIGLYASPTDLEVKAAKKWLSLGGFENRENETFGSLSYGEQRAILILRSAVKCPKVLILDEPCHGLDEDFRKKILNLLELIAETKTTTMLHVTHETSEVLPCEKHILELVPGQDPMYKIITQK